MHKMHKSPFYAGFQGQAVKAEKTDKQGFPLDCDFLEPEKEFRSERQSHRRYRLDGKDVQMKKNYNFFAKDKKPRPEKSPPTKQKRMAKRIWKRVFGR